MGLVYIEQRIQAIHHKSTINAWKESCCRYG